MTACDLDQFLPRGAFYTSAVRAIFVISFVDDIDLSYTFVEMNWKLVQ